METTAQTLVAEHVQRAWTSNPLVLEAARRAGWETSTTNPLDLLTALSETLNEIEEKLPGISFTQAFDAVRVGTYEERTQVVQALIQGGCEQDEANNIAGLRAENPALPSGAKAKVSEKAERAKELLLAGAKPQEVCDQVGLKLRRVQELQSLLGLAGRSRRATNLRSPERSREIARVVFNLGSMKAAARHLGLAYNTVKGACDHVARLDAELARTRS